MSQVSDPAGDVALARADVTTHPQASFWTLTLGAIGVVYGDIGTSPLYAMRESIAAAVGPAMPPTKRLCSEFSR